MKRVICVVALLVVLFAAVPAHAQSYVGSYCWKLDNYNDTFVWKVTIVTDNTYQLTGWSPYFPMSALTGMARLVPGTQMLFGSMVVANYATGWRQHHTFVLELNNSTGTSKFNYTFLDGTSSAGITAPFHAISCNATWAPEPGQVSTESLVK